MIPEEASTVPPPLATPARRLGGFLIDSVLYALIFLMVAALFNADIEAVAAGEEAIPNSVLLVDVLIIGVYQVTLTALRGQTVGKIVVRTKVVDSQTGEIPSWQDAFIRWGAPAALSTVPYLGYFTLVMYAWLIWDGRRQGLHDKLAQTVVIGV